MVVKVSGKVAGEGAKMYLANPAIDKSPINPDDAHISLFSELGKVRPSQKDEYFDFWARIDYYAVCGGN